ncbi:MAG: tRNA (adenosine(37)-N6)-threonylcarbamoyltransferase complex ATPase subunit type 1 TsaE [Ilumatobacteraceae bacterium]
MIELRSESAAETRAIAAAIAALARAGDLIVLAGQMGAGKTAFAQGFARELGVREPVTSPTYTLVHTYPAVRTARRTVAPMAEASANTNLTTLHHADLYRLEHTVEVADLALAELLEDDAIVLVEWGDMVELGQHLQVELRTDDADDDADQDSSESRDITITSNDKRWETRWDRLAAAVQRWAA